MTNLSDGIGNAYLFDNTALSASQLKHDYTDISSTIKIAQSRTISTTTTFSNSNLKFLTLSLLIILFILF